MFPNKFLWCEVPFREVGVIQCSTWNEVVGGMKLSELSGFPPIYSLILPPSNTQCACERACHGSTPGHLECMCMDNVAKNGCCWKRKKGRGVGMKCQSLAAEEGWVPEHQKKAGWVADRS